MKIQATIVSIYIAVSFCTVNQTSPTSWDGGKSLAMLVLLLGLLPTWYFFHSNKEEITELKEKPSINNFLSIIVGKSRK
jgi:hypothetical protein